MSTRTVITHAQIQGEACAQCDAFGEIVPATHVAHYVPERAGYLGGDRQEALCLPCASNPRIYCGVRPLSRGVSLGKSSDRPQGDVVLCAPYGDGTAPEMRVTLAKVACDWCDDSRTPALFSAVSFAEGKAWVERFCKHHAYRFGAFRPVGFVESV